MFENSCRSCLTNDGILVSLTTESNHRDYKSLLDYLNMVLGSSVKYFDNPSFICLRCSKALQVAYHFINLAMESEQTLRNYYCIGQEKEIVGNPNVEENNKQEMQNSYIVIAKTQSNFEIRHIDNKINFENQFELHINKVDKNCKKPEVALPNDLKLQQTKQIASKGVQEALTNDLKLKEYKPISYEGVQKTKEFKEFQNLNCNSCDQLFENKDLLEQHKQMHKGILPFKCKMCKFYSCYSESLLKHYNKDHGLSNVELKLYQRKEIYNIVAEKPHFELSFRCFECDFESLSQSIIDAHLLNEHFIDEDKDLFITKFYNCPACHRLFNELRSARTHYTMAHVSLEKTNKFYYKKHACKKCGKLFNLKTGLLMHKRICEPRDPVNCNFCELQFSTVLKYEQHLKIKHSVAIKHVCEICAKSFACSEFLAIHRKRHNERYYQCDLCPKNYINNSELKVHKQRMHCKNVQKQCAICGKFFSHLTLLRNHENKEHLNKYHKCAYCEFKSHSKFIIKIHQYKHTGKPYKCKLCTKEFVFRKDIKQHCQKHHSLVLTDEEMADMFKQANGYTSRFDTFTVQNNNLELAEFNELELEGELKEFGLTLQDIMDDLFDSEKN